MIYWALVFIFPIVTKAFKYDVTKVDIVSPGKLGSDDSVPFSFLIKHYTNDKTL